MYFYIILGQKFFLFSQNLFVGTFLQHTNPPIISSIFKTKLTKSTCDKFVMHFYISFMYISDALRTWGNFEVERLTSL